MAASRAHLKAVTAWVSQFANLTAGNQIGDIESRIAGVSAMLAEDFPDVARFTPEALRGVAAECNSFPPYAKLRDLLAAYWKQHPSTGGTDSPPVGFAGLAQTAMPGEDRMGVTVWLQRHAENKLPRSDMVLRLAVVRRYHPQGYRWLIAHNDLARTIAAEKSWHEPEHRRAPPDDAEQEAVARAVHGRPTTTTNAAGEKLTTQDAVDPDPTHQADTSVVARLVAKLEAQKGRKLGALDPAVLEAMRANNGAMAAARMVNAQLKAERDAKDQPAAPPPADPPGPTGDFASNAAADAAAVHADHVAMPWDDPP
jgi:hypothetical protein